MKNKILTMSILLALTGCGSDSDSSENVVASKITALDGYLSNAKVYADTNENGVFDASEDEELGLTDDNGEFIISDSYNSYSLFVQAIAGETVDSNRGLVTDGFVLGTYAGNSIVSPMTSSVVSLMASDISIDLETAQQQVLASFSSLTDNSTLIFGDYLKSTTSTARALKMVGEQLVDYGDVTPSRKIEIVQMLSNDIYSEMEDNNGELDEAYYPTVVIPTDDSSQVTVTHNYKPNVKGELDEVSISLGESFDDIDVSSNFEDVDDAPLSYSIKEVNGEIPEITITEEGVITGTFDKAGEYKFEIYAKDIDGARSYPLKLDVSVISSSNSLPVLSETEHALIQLEIDDWYLKKGEYLDYIVDLSALFTDEDTLTYEATSSLDFDSSNKSTGFSMRVDNSELTFDYWPPRTAKAGEETITIHAFDDTHISEVLAVFELPEIIDGELPTVAEEPDFELEGQYLTFRKEEVIGDKDYKQVVCDIIYFDKDKTTFYTAKDELLNTSNCPALEADSLDMDSGISYTVYDNSEARSANYAVDGISFKSILEYSNNEYMINYSETNQDTDLSESELVRLSYNPLKQKSYMEIIPEANPYHLSYAIVDQTLYLSESKFYVSIDIKNKLTTLDVKAYLTDCDENWPVYVNGVTVTGPADFSDKLEYYRDDVSSQNTCGVRSEINYLDLPVGTYSVVGYPVNDETGVYEPFKFSFVIE